MGLRKFVLRLFARATHTRRQLVIPGIDFEWSKKSIVYNLFRVYEYCFGREFGIRPEAAMGMSTSGEIVRQFFTAEALLVHYESVLYDFFKAPKFVPVKIAIPALAPAGFALPNPTSPYLFAIAFDVASNVGIGAGSPLTNTHTVTGSNTMIMAGTVTGVAAHNTTGITYNSVALSATGNITMPTDRNGDHWHLEGAATGSNTISVSYTGSFCKAGAASYSGVKQTGQPDSSATSSASSVSSPQTFATTVVASNCWLVGVLGTFGVTSVAAGTGTTNRQNTFGDNSTFQIYDSNGTVGTGSQSLQVTFTGTGNVAGIMASFAPAAAAYTFPALELGHFA